MKKIIYLPALIVILAVLASCASTKGGVHPPAKSLSRRNQHQQQQTQAVCRLLQKINFRDFLYNNSSLRKTCWLLQIMKVHRRIIEFMSMLSIWFLFEFFTLLIHPIVGRSSNNTPLIEFLIFVCLAGIMVPTYHHLTTWLKVCLTNLQKWEKHAAPPAPDK